MEHVLCVAWLILYPIGLAVEKAILYRYCNVRKDYEHSNVADIFCFFLYVMVAVLLW